MLPTQTLYSRPLRLLSALSIALASIPSHSATAPGSVLISAGVPAVCGITGGAIAFGNYNSAQVDQSTNIGVLCTHGTSYTIAMDAGNGSGATVNSRVMTGSSGGTLNYSLYGDVSRTTVWGNTAGAIASGTGSGLLQNIAVYGRIVANQTPQTGLYADTVSVTLTY